MSKFKNKPNNVTGASSNLEVLFDRPTAWEHPQDVLRLGLLQSALEGETVLFDVLSGIGKSFNAAKIADVMPVSVFTNLQDNYDQFEEWCEEAGVDFDKFPISTDDCPTLRGDYPDEDVVAAAKETYRKGWSVSTIHDELDLPCQHNGPCPYIKKIRTLDTEGRGLLVGYHNQAYVGPYVDGRVIVLDEDAFKEYYEDIDDPAKLAQEYIDTLDDFPHDKVEPLTGRQELRDEVLARLEKEGLDPDDHKSSIDEFHAKAPLIAYAIYGAEELGNGLRYAELPGNGTAVFDKLYETTGNGYDDGAPTIWLFDPPNLSRAEAVIALDATPSLSKWESLLGDDFEHYRLFDDDQRNRYLREQGYKFIQLNSHAWPAQGGGLNLDKCEAYLREVYREHGERPDLITSLAVLGNKDSIEGLKDRDLDHLWNREMHYGDLRGKNKLEDSDLLVVLGSPSRSDSYYERLAALLGESAERVEDRKGANLSYGNEVADEILETTRRGGVLQAAMRSGRKDDVEATVYIATGLVPNWLDTKKAGQFSSDWSFDACRSTRTPNQKAVIEALQDEQGISAGEIIQESGVNRKSVGRIRRELQKQGLIEKEGKGRWAEYTDIGLQSLNIAGEVDLSPIPQTLIGDQFMGIRGIEYPIIPPRDPSRLPSEERYPDWMRNTMLSARDRKLDEQLKQR